MVLVVYVRCYFFVLFVTLKPFLCFSITIGMSCFWRLEVCSAKSVLHLQSSHACIPLHSLVYLQFSRPVYTRPLFICIKSYVGIETSWRYHIHLGLKQVAYNSQLKKNIVTAATSNTKLQACQIKFRQSKHKKPLLGGLAISG